MKKIISAMLLLAMLLTFITACGGGSGGGAGNGLGDLDPATAVKLLLASERLDPSKLKTKGDIFENGVAVMTALAQKTAESMTAMEEKGEYAVLTSTVHPVYGASAKVSETVYDNPIGGGLVTSDGTNYLFSDFIEVSNSYKAFSGTANGIQRLAEEAANMIDNIKKNVRIVDTWVELFPNEAYLLHVGENEEILYGKREAQKTICRRYRNEEGQYVYEYYLNEEKFTQRLVYIPGVHFEFIVNHGDMNDYMIADNTKGYWESYWVGPHPTHYNVSYFVMKDDICYDSFYNPKTGEIEFLKIISADKKTDLFWYQSSESAEHTAFEVHLCGFDGYKGLQVKASDVGMEEMGGEAGSIPMARGRDVVSLLLNNGKTVRTGDTFVEGKVTLEAIRQTYVYPDYTGTLQIGIHQGSVKEKLEIFREFLAETGLSCRRDLDTVLAGVQRAFDELGEVTKYYSWNGHLQATEEGIAAAIKICDAYTKEFAGLWDNVVNAETVVFDGSEAVSLKMHFAPVTVDALTPVKQAATTLTLDEIRLSVSDTLLFVENEGYTVHFALEGESGFVHLTAEGGGQTATYEKADSFSVGVTGVTLTLPELVPGEYRLVAYIATADGIRSSGVTPVAADSVDPAPITMSHTRLTLTKGEDTLLLKYETVDDVMADATVLADRSYASVHKLLATDACKYGVPAENPVEVLGEDGNYTALTGNETDLPDGQYRLAYGTVNGEVTRSGYVYTTLGAAANVVSLDTDIDTE